MSKEKIILSNVTAPKGTLQGPSRPGQEGSGWDPMTCPACWSPLKDTGTLVTAVVPPRKKILCTGCNFIRYDAVEETS